MNSNKPAPQRHASENAVAQTPLFDEALRTYLRKENGRKSSFYSWVLEPGNRMSIIAFVISVMGVLYGFYKDHADGIDKEQQALSSIAVELTKLDTEWASLIIASVRAKSSLLTQVGTGGVAGSQRYLSLQANDPIEKQRGELAQQEVNALAEWGRVANNRRLALLAEADRLIADLDTKSIFAWVLGKIGVALPQKVTSSELAVLGTAYQQVYQYERAMGYFLRLTGPENSELTRATGWSSAANVAALRGRDFYQTAREYYAKGFALLEDSVEPGTINQAVMIGRAGAVLDMFDKDENGAVEMLLRSARLAVKIPCRAGQSGVLAPVRQAVAEAQDAARERDVILDPKLNTRIDKILYESCEAQAARGAGHKKP